MSPEKERKSVSFSAVIVILILVFSLVYLMNTPFLKILLKGLRFSEGQYTISAGNESSLSYSKSSFLVNNISYQSDYKTLEQYALSLINTDREKAGLKPVSESPIPAGQQHANSMLYFGYFSHWDTQGYKPYMRYSVLGGEGAVEENIAYESWTGPHFTNTDTVMQSLSKMEYEMMNNDMQCCNNGHRDNILNPLHNRVSIGIAYNSTTLFFVQDFENYYINGTVKLYGSDVIISGKQLQEFSPKDVLVFFDPLPKNLTSKELSAYPRAYDPGTYLGGALPPCTILCSQFEGGITVYASKWTVTGKDVTIVFSLSEFVRSMGKGVYTVYLLLGNRTDEAITSVSFFITSQ
jgi:uncharacterized protein YkwD